MNKQPAPTGAEPPRAKVSVPDLAAMKKRGEAIAMVTVYDAPSARLADAAGIDVSLVGDSAAMTVLGHDSTLPITMDEMVMLTRAVVRGTSRPMVVADMPFGSFQPSDDVAVQNAVRFLKEGGADAVKIEGAGPMLRRVEAIVDSAVPVMGHIGLTPQSVKLLGGYKPQGRTAIKARRLVDAARALERAGCFAIVLEAIPAVVAAHITRALTIPTIGIGAGVECDGQVLVWQDLLGISTGHVARFVKRYAEIGANTLAALEAYVADVRAHRFPEERHTYPMPEHELDMFEVELMAAAVDKNEA
jgi:3-methyl-2-oxobutanoate hydroxymethyltransferase